jgi:hypothetical protein
MNIEQYPHAFAEMKQMFSRPDLPKPPVDIKYVWEQCKGDADLEQLFAEMLESFYSYTEITFKYIEFQHRKTSGDVDKAEVDAEEEALDRDRRIIHNATIDNINILARVMQQKGRDGNWVKNLKGSRALYGYLALTETFKQLVTQKEEGKENQPNETRSNN